MKEIYPGIYMINIKSRFKLMKPPTNIYAIVGKEDGLIYDSGYGNRKFVKHVVKQINEVKKIEEQKNNSIKFNRILISHAHPDHFSGLYQIRKKLGLKIVLTNKMAHLISSQNAYRQSYIAIKKDTNGIFGKIRVKFDYVMSYIIGFTYNIFYGIHFVKDPDIIIDEKCSIEINKEKWEIFPSPGHSHDHISFYNKKKGILFAGDNILRKKTSWLGPPKSDLLKYVSSMEELLKLPNLKLVLSAHGSPITNPQKRIGEIIDWRLKRIEDVFKVIEKYGKDGINFNGIFRNLYPRQNIVKFYLIRGWIQLTLKYLQDHNRILKKNVKNKVRYFSANTKKLNKKNSKKK